MEQLFAGIGTWIEGLGPWAYLLAPLLMAAVAILPVPAEAPAMMNGLLFGPVAGTAVTWVGAMLGAIASFELARAFGRPAAERLLRPASLARADEFATRAGWGGLLFARLLPFVAFTALNWGAGLTPVRRWRFVWTTAVGIVPGAIAFTVSGWGFAALLERLPWAAGALAVALLAGLWGRAHLRSRAGEERGPAEP